MECNITSAEIVQGEKLQALASATLMTPGYTDYVSKYKHANNPHTYIILPGDHDNFYNVNGDNLKQISQHKSIFIFGNMARSFFNIVAPNLSHEYVLLIHNSDENIDEYYRHWIDANPNITRIFAQNAMINHPRLEAVPIGIANWMWPWGNDDMIANTTAPKTELCYVQFNEKTNHTARIAAWSPSKYFGVAPNLSFPEYILLLARHKFAICPVGNGADTHRFWECLYVGTIPVVLGGHPLLEHWKRIKVPMVIVDKWTDVTPDLLNSLDTDTLLTHSLPQLSMSYWRERINPKQ